MEKNQRKRFWGVFFFTVFFALALFGFLVVYRVKPVTESFYVELGDELTKNLWDYIDGYDWSVERATLSCEDVNAWQVGEYDVFVDHGWQHFTYQVFVVDTTPPIFEKKIGQIYCKVKEDYPLDYFYESVSDLSGEVIVRKINTSNMDAFMQEQVYFEDTGFSQIQFLATDAYGNETILEVEVLVDTPPSISNVPEYYLKLGDCPYMPDGVTAYDTVDGDLTNQLRLNCEGFCQDMLGEQEVYFEVTDSYGLTTSVVSKVHVYDELEICEMISNREISIYEDEVSEVLNYFDGGAKELESLNAQMEYMLPSLVFIDTDYHSSKVLYVHGSGFIVHMDEDFVYIMSNEHVLQYTEVGTAYFFDGTSANYTVVDTNKEADIAVARIATEDISKDTLEKLFYIHPSYQAYENVLSNSETKLFMEILGTEGLAYTESGVSVKESEDFYVVEESCLQVTIPMKAGNSGSAIIDEYGNLIGMCVGLRYDSDIGYRYYCIPMRFLIDFYETVTGNEIFIAIEE